MTADQKATGTEGTQQSAGGNYPPAMHPGDGGAVVTRSTPIWFAALQAVECHAVSTGAAHAVRWGCVSGRAVYTNCSADAELIEPLGVRLRGGDTLAVSWEPGEGAYTLEVYDLKTHYVV
jgi:hypothetical protein